MRLIEFDTKEQVTKRISDLNDRIEISILKTENLIEKMKLAQSEEDMVGILNGFITGNF